MNIFIRVIVNIKFNNGMFFVLYELIVTDYIAK